MKVANIALALLGIFSVVLLAYPILWSYPRSAVVEPYMFVAKDEYKVGESLYGDVTIQNNVDTIAHYSIKLICEDVLFYTLRELPNIRTTKMTAPITVTQFPFGVIPEQVATDLDSFDLDKMTCRIESRGTYPIDIAPLLEKNLYYTIVSNNFTVTK